MNLAVLISSTANGTQNAGSLTVTWSVAMFEKSTRKKDGSPHPPPSLPTGPGATPQHAAHQYLDRARTATATMKRIAAQPMDANPACFENVQ